MLRLGTETDAWELEDAEERNGNAPDLYRIPPLAERSAIRAGDNVELLFLFRGCDQHGQFIQSERLLVSVLEADAGKYAGALISRPASSTLVQPGDRIAFEPRHIAGILSSTANKLEIH
jgi:hypothetical protein